MDNIMECWLPILYAGVMSSGLAYTLQMEAQKKVPAANPVQAYINNEMAFMSQRLEISDRKEMREKFAQMRKALIEGGVIPDIPADKITLEQAKQMIEAMYANFFTDGEKK